DPVDKDALDGLDRDGLFRRKLRRDVVGAVVRMAAGDGEKDNGDGCDRGETKRKFHGRGRYRSDRRSAIFTRKLSQQSNTSRRAAAYWRGTTVASCPRRIAS